MGNTLRGISDALDEFHIVHEVYQLPAEYLKELECPFISVIQNGHFCIVKNMNEKIYYSAEDIAKMLGVSMGKAYKILREMNKDLASKGFLTIAGKIPVEYFREKWYGGAKEVSA